MAFLLVINSRISGWVEATAALASYTSEPRCWEENAEGSEWMWGKAVLRGQC